MGTARTVPRSRVQPHRRFGLSGRCRLVICVWMGASGCASPTTPDSSYPPPYCPSCTEIANNQRRPDAIAAGEEGVCWANYGAATSGVGKAPADGTIVCMTTDNAKITTVAQGVLGPRSISIAPGVIFWATVSGVYRAPRSGAEMPTVITEGGADIRSIALVDDRVCFSDRGKGELDCAPKTGGPVTPLATGLETIDLVISTDAGLIWADEGLVADGGGIARAGGIRLIDPVRGSVTTFADAPGSSVSALAAANRVLTWSDGSNVLLQSPVGDPTRVLGSGFGSVGALAVDAAEVYVASANGDVLAVSRADGTRVTLGRDQRDPHGLALRSDTLFWVNEWSGDVQQITIR